jgi:hypothetical protein
MPLYKLGCTSPMSPHVNFASKPNPSCHPSSTTSSVPLTVTTLFQSPPFKLNPVPAVRSQGPDHRRKNHVESWYVASTIYHVLPLFLIGVVTFPANLKSIRRHQWALLVVLSLSDFTDLKLEVYSSSYSNFQRSSSEQTPLLSSTFSSDQILQIDPYTIFI